MKAAESVMKSKCVSRNSGDVVIPCRSIPLGDICHFVRGPFGGSLKKSCFVETGYSVYEQQHAIHNQFFKVRYYIDHTKFEEMSRFKILSGDLIMSCSGTMGKVAIVPEGIAPGIINQALLIIRPNQLLSNEFLKYWMRSPNFQNMLILLSKGVAIKNVASVKVLKEIPIPLPPLPEQKRIVAILDDTFAAIETATINAKKNLANARELFDSELNRVFLQKGDGWEEIEIQDVTKLSRGHNPPKSTFVYSPQPGYVRFYQIRDGSSDAYKVYVPETPQLHRVKETDILMVAYRHVGRVFRGANGAFNVALCKITNSKPDRLDNDFLFYIIPSKLIRGELLKISERSLIPSMSVNELARLKIPLPPRNQQQTIVKKFDGLSEKTKNLETIYLHKLDALSELKQSILQKAFTGELTADFRKTDKVLAEAGL
jgi:type I restriction enzyme, S subunit